MAELSDIREGLAANLSAITDIQVSAYMLADPTPPSAHVIPGPIEYDQAFHRGHDLWVLLVQAFVTLAADIGSQQLLDELIASSGTRSVKAVLEADRTLGGVAQDLRVTECSGYQSIARPSLGGLALMAEWKVEIRA